MTINIAEPIKPTLLSLPYYAQIIGLNPVHFQGAAGDVVFPGERCSAIWPRWSWQNADQVSHEDLAHAIYDAEQDIARELGYFPAPTWIAQEQHRFPQHHRRDVYRRSGLNVRAQRVSIQARYAKIIQGGQRNVSLVGTATTGGGTLVYSDEDSDGYSETATIILTTTLTDACEIKVYHAGQSADQGWEIRPARSTTISGGSVTIVMPSWLFIDPDLFGAYPTTAGFEAIDVTTTANLVTSVDVYREFNDFTANAATFFWEHQPARLAVGSICTSCGGGGCAACSLIAQDGCLSIRDLERGIVVPVPATYSADDAAWSQDAYTECRDPDMVRLFYYAGDQDNRYLNGDTCEPLSNYWAHAIAWLTTARLDRDFCACANAQKYADHLRTDLAFSGERSYQISFELLNNPFGTRRGEVMAWQRVNDIQGRSLKGGVI